MGAGAVDRQKHVEAGGDATHGQSPKVSVAMGVLAKHTSPPSPPIDPLELEPLAVPVEVVAEVAVGDEVTDPLAEVDATAEVLLLPDGLAAHAQASTDAMATTMWRSAPWAGFMCGILSAP